MRRRIMLFCVFVLFGQTHAHALVSINEIYADPAAGLAGDANHDGVRSTTDDEFVEFFNSGVSTMNITGWRLNDAVAVRHIFPAGTFLLPEHYLVVFGGGLPQLPGVSWQLASTGGLSLNNTAETLTLFDLNNQLVQQVVYGSLANQDKSIVRFPEGSGTFVLHTTLADAEGRFFSPGTNVKGELPITEATVPEPSTLATMLLGSLTFFRRKL